MLRVLPILAAGLKLTILISVLGLVLALALGAGLVVAQRSRFRLLHLLTRVYTEIILGIPVLVLLYLVFFVLPALGIIIEPLPAGLLTLMLYYSPYMAEVIRGALNAVPAGQIEAGRAIGMSRSSIMRRIVAPQALGLMLPPLTGNFIGLIKDSAILSVISVMELTFQAKQVVSRTYAPFETYFLVAVGYWLLTFLVETATRGLERRVTRYRIG
jgi:polar amino acid transport system permease protein